MTVLENRAPATGAPAARSILPALSITGGATFAAAVAIAGWLDPGYSQRSEGISALASTESQGAGVMIAGFVALAVSGLAAGAALVRAAQNRTGRIAGGLVVVAGLLTLVAGFARQSCSSFQQSCLDRESAGLVTGSHVVHNLVALLGFLLLVVAAGLLTASLRRNPVQRKLFRIALVAVLAEVALFVVIGAQAYGSGGGLGQRLFVLLAYGLPILAATRLSADRA